MLLSRIQTYVFEMHRVHPKGQTRAETEQLTVRQMAEMVGFEPTDKGVKVLCLTTWRHLYICLVFPRCQQRFDQKAAKLSADWTQMPPCALLTLEHGQRGDKNLSRERRLSTPVEQHNGLEPSISPWKGEVLPLH